MAFTALDVAKLREQTGAGMMDCKKALTNTNGDMEKAAEYLREQGVLVAAKKADRLASEGAVAAFTAADGLTGALVEVNSESDFVAKSDDFLALAGKIAKHVAVENPKDVDTALAQKFCDDKNITITDLINHATAKIGEKLALRRFIRHEVKEGINESYIHMGGKIGVLIEVKSDKKLDAKNQAAAKEMCRDIAMHIAAFGPKYVYDADVPKADVDYEKGMQKSIIANDPKAKGKPDNVIEKMVEGRIGKFYKEICLINQDFAKDPSKTVAAVVAENSKNLGVNLSIVKFTRFVMGEGLEKKVDNLAEEVAKLQK